MGYFSDVTAHVALPGGSKVGEITVTEITRMGDESYTYSVRARVDRGSSVGMHQFVFTTSYQPNPLGLLKEALNAMDPEATFVEGEVVDDGSGSREAGPRALERGQYRALPEVPGQA